MRRRNLFTLAAGASAVLCIAVCVLWVRAHRVATPDYLSFRTPFGRAIARFDRGAVRLIGPPRAGPAAEEAKVRMLAGLMRNDDVCVFCLPRADDEHALATALFAFTTGRARGPTDFRNFTATTPNATFSLSTLYGEGQPPVTLDAYRRPLLEALEDPARFAVAHHLLYRFERLLIGPPRSVSLSRPLTFSNGVYVLDQDGLRVEIPPPDEQTQRRLGFGAPNTRATVFWTYYLDRPRLARIDPAQIPAVRDRWLMVLGTPLLAIPYWCIAGTAALLPAAWVVARNRRRVRAGRGLCRACGYDLRATPDRCPECGTVTVAKPEHIAPRPPAR